MGQTEEASGARLTCPDLDPHLLLLILQ